MSTDGFRERHREITEIKRNYPLLYPLTLAAGFIAVGLWIGSLIFRGDNGYGVNLYTEILSIFVTVFILDLLARWREQKRFKADLVFRMGSRVNHEAIRAVEELRRNGWTKDGSLQDQEFIMAELEGAILYFADLKKTSFEGADLGKAILQNANFEGANVTQTVFDGALLYRTIFEYASLEYASFEGAKYLEDWQLAEARSLRRAIMVDGSLYDGRFNLVSDVKDATRKAGRTIAEYYGISDEDYQCGQEWAQSNLSELVGQEEYKLRQQAAFSPSEEPDDLDDLVIEALGAENWEMIRVMYENNPESLRGEEPPLIVRFE